jgi:hypothetical protein
MVAEICFLDGNAKLACLMTAHFIDRENAKLYVELLLASRSCPARWASAEIYVEHCAMMSIVRRARPHLGSKTEAGQGSNVVRIGPYRLNSEHLKKHERRVPDLGH